MRWAAVLAVVVASVLAVVVASVVAVVVVVEVCNGGCGFVVEVGPLLV